MSLFGLELVLNVVFRWCVDCLSVQRSEVVFVLSVSIRFFATVFELVFRVTILIVFFFQLLMVSGRILVFRLSVAFEAASVSEFCLRWCRPVGYGTDVWSWFRLLFVFLAFVLLRGTSRTKYCW